MRKILIVLVLLAVAGGALFFALQRRQAAPSPAAPAGARPPTENVVELTEGDLFTVRAGEIGQAVRANGGLRAVAQSLVRAKVAGEIVEVNAREGERVRAGQVLARIDPLEYRARLAERQASLEGARAQAAVAESLRLKNEELLHKGYISRQAYDNAQASADANRAQMEALDAQVVLARKSLEDATVRAPVAGWVAERSVQRGDRTAVDGRLFSIVDLARLEMEALVPATEIARVAVGQGFEATVEGYGQRRFGGRVARIGPQALAGSRMVPVYVEFDNADGALRAGLFAEGRVQLASRPVAALVPLTAVREEVGGRFVYGVVEGRVRRQPVTLGVTGEGLAEVVEGLAPGARVVAANLGALVEGAGVRLVETKAAPGAGAAPRTGSGSAPAGMR